VRCGVERLWCSGSVNYNVHAGLFVLAQPKSVNTRLIIYSQFAHYPLFLSPHILCLGAAVVCAHNYLFKERALNFTAGLQICAKMFCFTLCLRVLLVREQFHIQHRQFEIQSAKAKPIGIYSDVTNPIQAY
jgi:hypothetical protein